MKELESTKVKLVELEETIADLNKEASAGNEKYEKMVKKIDGYKVLAKSLGANVKKSGKAVETALFDNEQLAAINKEQAKQLADERENSKELEDEFQKEIAALKKTITSPIVPKPVDKNSGKHVRNAVPERIVQTGRHGAIPHVFLVREIEAEKKKLEEEKKAKIA